MHSWLNSFIESFIQQMFWEPALFPILSSDLEELSLVKKGGEESRGNKCSQYNEAFTPLN